MKPNGEFKETCGFAEVPDPSKPAELVVKFPHSPAGDYWILETDYDNYVSIYTCENFLGFWKVEYAWVLARNPTNLTQEIMDTALNAFHSQNLLDTSKFVSFSQEGCTYENPSGAEPCS